LSDIPTDHYRTIDSLLEKGYVDFLRYFWFWFWLSFATLLLFFFIYVYFLNACWFSF
jgi:hypothetical protein